MPQGRLGCYARSVMRANHAIITLLLALLLLALALVPVALAQYTWANFAGLQGGFGHVDGTGAAARFASPAGIATDGNGNLYVADLDCTIRKVTLTGQVTTLAGKPQQVGSADGTGSGATFFSPWGVAADSAGNIYVADTQNHTIRKITPAGVVTTLAGQAGLNGSTDGTGNSARFNQPWGIAIGPGGVLYVADYGNSTIRKVTAAGVVTTLAGSAQQSGSTDGSGSAARFNNPEGLTVDASGNIYVADTYNHTIRKVTAAGVVTTLAGSAQFSGSTDGTGTAARFYFPTGASTDTSGNVYVGDKTSNTIRKVTPGGVVSTLAGSGGFGSADGTGSAAQFSTPQGTTVDSSGNIYVADRDNSTVRKVTPSRVVTTLAGTPPHTGTTDGIGSAARFNIPTNIAFDGSGNAYVADFGNSTIRKVTPSAQVTTYLSISAPQYIAADTTGNLFVPSGNTIKKISPTKVVTTLAGSSTASGSADGTGTAARFNNPVGLASDAAGNVYVADRSNHTVRKITPAAVVTTLAGSAGAAGSINGTGSAARFSSPSAVAVDGNGNVFVADKGNHIIRQITPTGAVTTLAGTPGVTGSADGVGAAASFTSPSGIAADAAGNIYVTDGNYIVRKITPAGVVSTIGGTAGVRGGADGVGAAAQFSSLAGIAVTSAGQVFVVDSNNNNVMQGTAASSQAPVLSAPVSAATLGATVNVAFNLPEAAADGSVVLSFSGAVSRNLTLAASQETMGNHSFTFSPANPAATVAIAGISGGAAIPDGSYDVKLTYQDAGGNLPASSNIATNVLIDSTPPTFTLPQDMTVTAPNASGVVVTYNASASDSGSGLASVSISPVSGGTFPLGATVVTATATDQAGNTTTASFTITVLSPAQSWRQQKFGTTENSGNAADDADPNGNGISNLFEYTLNGDPTGMTTGQGILPVPLISDQHLQLELHRYLSRTDVTLTVQGSDSPQGPWTDLARSTAGGAFEPLITGVFANESGTNDQRTVTVSDPFSPTDPAHKQRFMRLQVTRP